MYDMRKLFRTVDLTDTFERDGRSGIRTGDNNECVYRGRDRNDCGGGNRNRGKSKKENSLRGGT